LLSLCTRKLGRGKAKVKHLRKKKQHCMIPER